MQALLDIFLYGRAYCVVSIADVRDLTVCVCQIERHGGC